MIEGATVGQYRIHRKIGEGGMGAVYLAEHTLIGRRAAIKVLLPQLSSQREIVDRFFNEARATTSIPDPGIVQVFDFGFSPDGSAYIVMEFLEGEPLDARMKRFGRLTSFDALRITRQAAGSLGAAHAAGIIHRDLKPENIFLVRDPEAQGGERPKILDFGIAKLGGLGNQDGNQMRTRTGALMGTPVYMSPEQCRGAGLVDHRSDIYAMGCVIFHMITGRPPFEADGIGEIIAAHLREPAPAASSLAPGIPEGVDDLLHACLAKAPEQRFQSMADLQLAADHLMARITASGVAGTSAATIAATPLAPGFRSEYPGASSTPIPGTVPPIPGSVTVPLTPTTLGAAAGASMVHAPPTGSKKGLWIGLAALLVGGGIAAALVLSGGKGQGDEGAAAKPPTAAAQVDAGAGAAAVVAAPDAAVAAVAAPDAGVAGVTTAVETTPPDAGTTTAVAEPKTDPKRDAKKKKKKKTTTTTGSQDDLYAR